MKYIQIVFLYPVLIFLLIACNPTLGEETQILVISPTSSDIVPKEATEQPSPTQTVFITPTVHIKSTATHQVEIDTPPTPTVIPTQTQTPVPTATDTPSFVRKAPPTTLTFSSQCEVWKKETDGTVTQITDTVALVSGFSISDEASAVAYIVGGIDYEDLPKVYLTQMNSEEPTLIFDPTALDAPNGALNSPNGEIESLRVKDVAFSSDGSLLALTTAWGVWLFDMDTNQLKFVDESEWPDYVVWYESPVFSPDNEFLLLTVHHGDSRSERILELATGIGRPVPGVQGYTQHFETLGWLGNNEIVRHIDDLLPPGGEFYETSLGVYSVPDFQEISSYLLGKRDFFESQYEDFVMISEEMQGQDLLTPRWQGSIYVPSVVVDSNVYFLVSSYDVEGEIYTTIIQWEPKSETWHLLYKSLSHTLGKLHAQRQINGDLVFYVDTLDDIFYLNLKTQSPELIAENASLRSNNMSFKFDGCYWSEPQVYEVKK